MSTNIYGLKGISIKLLSPFGNVKTRITVTKFQEDLRVLLETKKGTLVGDPAFGSNLIDLLYEPANEATAALIRHEVANSIEAYYPNVSITQVDVTFTNNTIKLKVYYILIDTNINDTVILEFIRQNYN